MGWNEVLALWDAETPTVITEQEKSRRNAVWEIFTNECTFLVDHIMVLKNVSVVYPQAAFLPHK